MTESISHEDAPVDIPADHAPVNVRIVEDSTSGKNEPEKAPRRLDTRSYVIPVVGNGPLMQRLAGKNVKRARMLIWTDAGNAGIIYLADRPVANPAQQTGNMFGMGPGAQLEATTSHEIFVYGANQNDVVYVWEESYDA